MARSESTSAFLSENCMSEPSLCVSIAHFGDDLTSTIAEISLERSASQHTSVDDDEDDWSLPLPRPLPRSQPQPQLIPQPLLPRWPSSQHLFSGLLRPFHQLQQQYRTSKKPPSSSSTSTIGMRNNDNKNQKDYLLDKYRLNRMRDLVSNQVRVRLNCHQGECWMVHFSPSGEYLASFGMDQTLLIWQDIMTLEPTVAKTFTFKRPLTNMKWSPDSKHILALLGKDSTQNYIEECEMCLLDLETSITVFTKASPESLEGNCTFGWLTDSKHFITVRSTSVVFWDLQGRVAEEYKLDIPVQLMEVIGGRREMIVVTQDDSRLFHVSFYGPVPTQTEMGQHSHIHYLYTCPKGEAVLVSIEGNENLHQPAAIALYDLRSLRM
ncbi:hypothetical protein BGZ83_008436, partial [Gryganskiella cystojenkinii]